MGGVVFVCQISRDTQRTYFGYKAQAEDNLVIADSVDRNPSDLESTFRDFANDWMIVEA